ncbi:glycosyl hydrolase catalytic core-domain-containing protein [Xylariaceae sp. FL1651]|nr:glycosyl hydrolase catalytic core-domain-containing protein [Xylariaceae sp. FL1651]
MFSKVSLMALCAAATVKEVAAGHAHQHVHPNKRDIVWAATDTVVVTDYVTVTVTEGEQPTVAAIPSSIKGRPSGHAHSEHHSHVSSSISPSATPTSIAAEPSSTSVMESSAPIAVPTTTAVPTVIPTTMITAVKPTTPVIESPPAVSSPIETTTPVVELPTVVIPTTSSTSAAPTATAVASHGGKRGLAFNDASLVQEFLSLGGQAAWAYNWGSSSSGLPDAVTYYPMLWSPAPDHSNGWDTNAEEAISKGADALLGFNEPDIASQANMSPQDAAAGHIKMMNPYAGKARISSPAISSSENANQGIDWLKQFFNACNGQCQVDFCAAHWYGPGGVDGANLFLQHLKDVNTACDGKPVWATEFAAESGSVDDFMTTIVKALESDEYSFVEKYSYFMAGVGELFTSSTDLSSYGRIYAGLA